VFVVAFFKILGSRESFWQPHKRLGIDVVHDRILNPILILLMMTVIAYINLCPRRVRVICLSQDRAPVSALSYSNQAVPVERVILDILDEPVASN
jgi:hypothetical protein